MSEKRLFEENRYSIKSSLNKEEDVIVRSFRVYDSYKEIPITPEMSMEECETILNHLNYHKEIISTRDKQLKYVNEEYNNLKGENEWLKFSNRAQKTHVDELQDTLILLLESKSKLRIELDSFGNKILDVINTKIDEVETNSEFNTLNDLKKELVKLDERVSLINNCEKCIHFNELIHWDEGLFYQCMRRNKLWSKCDDFEEV